MNAWLRLRRLGLLALVCLLLAPPVAWAADEPEEKLDLEAIEKERKKRQASNSVNRRISRYLAAAAEASARAGNPSGAYIGAGDACRKHDRYPQAIAYYKKVLALPATYTKINGKNQENPIQKRNKQLR